MKYLIFFVSLLSFTSLAQTTRGTKPLGNPTLGQPTYPNSGQLKNWSNDTTGKDMSNATHMGTNQDPRVPTRTPIIQRQEDQDEIPTGPYQDGEYQYIKKK